MVQVEYEALAARLETERLLLEPMRLSDAERYAELIAERGPDGRGHGTTVDQARRKISRMAEAAALSGIGFLAVRRSDEAEMIGYCGLLMGRASFDEPEIAFELLAREHGRGYATEAARALLEAARATGRRGLWATVGEWNAPSLRVLHKLDFRRHHTMTASPGADLIYLSRSL